MPYTYQFPRPALTADIVIFGFDGSQLKVLLIQRNLDPFSGSWALPGGFLHEDETLEACAMRELYEETHFTPAFLDQFRTYSAIDRDPRGRVVTVAYMGLMPIAEVRGGTDASDAQWFSLSQLPELAFDHKDILAAAQRHLRERIYFEPIAFHLLDPKFTMTELQHVYEIILDTQFDRRNFQKKMLASQIIAPVGERRSAGASRPANLYSFVSDQYHQRRQAAVSGLEF